MIGPTRAVRIFVHREPVDMRKSFDTLAAVVREAMDNDVLRGDVFVFVGRRRHTAKVLWWDGTGMCLFAKRIGEGCFAAPWARPGDGALRWTTSELALFLEGSDHVGRLALSPPPLRPADRRIDFR
jgi:transposase